MRDLQSVLCAIEVIALAVTPIVTPQRETRERTIIASVVDTRDAPVQGLTIKDFVVRENDLAREVTGVSPAPAPSHIAILLDDSQAARDAIAHLRPAMTGFVKQMAGASPAPQMAIWTFGERPTRRVNFTTAPDALLQEVGRLFPVTGAGAYFLESITEAIREFRSRSAERPVIVAFVSESGPEFSNTFEKQVTEGLRSVGASLWVVTLQVDSQPLNTTAARERARVLGDSTAQSGGHNDVILNAQALETAFAKVAAALTQRYAVTYGRPDSLIPPDRVQLEVRREGLRVHATQWAGK